MTRKTILMLQSQTTNQPTAPQGRDTEHQQSHDSNNNNQSNVTISFFLCEMVANLEKALHCKHSQDIVSGHCRPTNETPFKWRFVGGSIVARCYTLSTCACITFFSFLAVMERSGLVVECLTRDRRARVPASPA